MDDTGCAGGLRLAARDDLVFWTGGFDSTFRVLDRLFNRGLTVCPVYLVDLGRPSHELEIETMSRLRRLITDRDRGACLAPLHMFSRAEIVVDANIVEAAARLRARDGIGTQYAWLTQFARDHGIGPGGIELGLNRSDSAEAWHRRAFDDPYGPAPRPLPGDATVVFGPYRLPVIGLRKTDMRRIARESGFEDILDQTWFCHSPIGGKPCGACHPCQETRVQRPDEIAFASFGGLRLSVQRELRRLRVTAGRWRRQVIGR
jgi:hypothetical protein